MYLCSFGGGECEKTIESDEEKKDQRRRKRLRMKKNKMIRMRTGKGKEVGRREEKGDSRREGTAIIRGQSFHKSHRRKKAAVRYVIDSYEVSFGCVRSDPSRVVRRGTKNGYGLSAS